MRILQISGKSIFPLFPLCCYIWKIQNFNSLALKKISQYLHYVAPVMEFFFYDKPHGQIGMSSSILDWL